MKREILHIPGKPQSMLDQSTVDVLASTIEPKIANILVRKLNQIYPLENLRHVKRVRRRSVEGNIELSVILCLPNGNDNNTEGLSDDLLQLINVYQLKPFKAKVAKFAAMSKKEWEEQCNLWTTSYHPPNNLDGVGFSDEDSQLIFKYMEVAIRLTKPSCLVGKDEDTLINHGNANDLPSESLRPYLCTGFDMYLVWEPCAMCAMGLVHQRIRRIFYAFTNPNAGALGSVYRLQGEKSLNHHYSVFQILLPEKILHEVELNSSYHSFNEL